MSPATATLGATPKIAGEIFWGAAQQPRSPLPERVRVLPSPSSARGQRGQDGPGSTFGVPELNSPQSRAASRRGEARSLPPTSRSERRPRLQSRPEVVPVTPPARRGGWGGGRGRRHTWSGSRGTESRQEQAQHLHPHRLPGSPMALPPSRCRGRGPRAALRSHLARPRCAGNQPGTPGLGVGVAPSCHSKPLRAPGRGEAAPRGRTMEVALARSGTSPRARRVPAMPREQPQALRDHAVPHHIALGTPGVRVSREPRCTAPNLPSFQGAGMGSTGRAGSPQALGAPWGERAPCGAPSSSSIFWE